MVKREIISLHIGQAGIQLANAQWELYCLEHNIDNDGYLAGYADDNKSDKSYETFFQLTEENRYVPRAVFFDTESMVIDEISSGVYNSLYHPLQMIHGCEDAANNFARGSLTIAKRHIFDVLERVRKTLEQCDSPESFLFTHSMGGGTGGGFTAVLAHALQGEYSRYIRAQIPIYPGQALSTSVVEPYNTVLHMHSTVESMDLTMLFGNEALYELAENQLCFDSPSYTQINRIAALIISSSTAALRFDSTLNIDFGEILTNLVPYPKIHYPVLRMGPLMHRLKADHYKPTSVLTTRELFSNKYRTLKTEPGFDCYISIVLNFRGEVSQRDVNDSVQALKKNRDVSFVDWVPTGIKVSVNNTLQYVVPDSNIALTKFSVSTIANISSIKEAWSRMCRKFHSLFDKRAFIHWFVEEGMEESEFHDAFETLVMLIEDYGEMCLTTDEIDTMLDRDSYEEDEEEGDEDEPGKSTDLKDEGDPDEDKTDNAEYNLITDSQLMARRHTPNSSLQRPYYLKPSQKHLLNRNKVRRKISHNRSKEQTVGMVLMRAESDKKLSK